MLLFIRREIVKSDIGWGEAEHCNTLWKWEVGVLLKFKRTGKLSWHFFCRSRDSARFYVIPSWHIGEKRRFLTKIAAHTRKWQ